jgi:hypothetical protein
LWPAKSEWDVHSPGGLVNWVKRQANMLTVTVYQNGGSIAVRSKEDRVLVCFAFGEAGSIVDSLQELGKR